MHNSIPPALINEQVKTALAEDLGHGDLTAALVPADKVLEARLIVRENAILCGNQWFNEVFRQLNPNISIKWQAHDGESLKSEQLVCTIIGNARDILTGERTAMNFLQTLSGTASITHRYASELKHSNTRLLDTRKTIPGMRSAQKYAVRCGTGFNHRHGLFDGVLIKENHIIAAGSIKNAVSKARETIPHGLKVEVEVETLDEVKKALKAGADILLLDNMPIENLHKAVKLNQGRAKLEVSGNVTIENLRQLGEIGVDYISVGAITKHIRATDYSLRLVP